MKKTKELKLATEIIATMLKDYTEQEILEKSKLWLQDFKAQISARIAVAVILAALWDMYEEVDADYLLNLFERYLDYFDSLMKGNEKICRMVLAVNNIVGGRLLSEKVAEAIDVSATLEDELDSKCCERCIHYELCKARNQLTDECEHYVKDLKGDE